MQTEDVLFRDRFLFGEFVKEGEGEFRDDRVICNNS
jgi:hypothetical protein